MNITALSSPHLQIQPVVSRSNQMTNPQYGIARDEEGGRAHSTKKGPFHEIFNLPENEHPLPGMRRDTVYCQWPTSCLDTQAISHWLLHWLQFDLIRW